MKKLGKNKGWVIPDLTIKQKHKYIIDNVLEPQKYWDDWNEPRDGLRGSLDKTKIQNEFTYVGRYANAKRWNRKNKKMLKIRLAKKTGRSI